MPEPVLDELLERARLVQQAQHGVGDRDATDLSPRADVVLADAVAAAQRHVDAATVVVDVHVVADRRAIPVQRQRPVVHGVGDEQRDDLLRVLVVPERVAAARDGGIEPV